MSTQTHDLTVSGMSCQHCVKAITQAIQGEDPSAIVEVELPQGLTRVTTTLARDTVAHLIEEEGYVVQA